MFNLGVVPQHLESTSVHSPTFVADEAAIPIGVNLMANILLDHALADATRTKKKR
jgi:metal-dependent amidase/aminoacylase/carboxypeptidase family protein